MSRVPAAGTKGVPRPEREQQIIEVAIAEFARSGYARASVVTIARGAGISKPLVYQYFGSKDGLFLACLHRVAGALLGRLEEAELAVDDSVASRIHPLRAVFDALEPQRDAWRLMHDPTLPVTGAISAATESYRERLVEIAAGGAQRFLRARGSRNQRDASALTAVWMGLVDSLVGWWLDHPDESAAAMIERCGRLFAAVVGAPTS